MKTHEIAICIVEGGMGGPTVKCTPYKLLKQDDMKFILENLVKTKDTYFDLYPLNDIGMHYIEKLGLGSSYGVEKRYFSIKQTHKEYFSLETFLNGKYTAKWYRKGLDNENTR